MLIICLEWFLENSIKAHDNLSKTLQNPSLTVSDGQPIAQLTIKMLQQSRTTEAFGLFWQKLLLLHEELE